METASLKSRMEFDREGAIIVRSVLAPDEVGAVRERLHSLFAPYDARPGSAYVSHLTGTTVLQRPDALLAAMRPRVVEALKAILEPDYAMIPDFQVQRNSFVFGVRRSALKLFGLIGPGWHHDSGDERTNSYLFENDYRVVKCGLFLQDNNDEFGGGIDIAPGAHRRVFLTGRPNVDFYLQRIRHNFHILAGWRSLDIKAGDFVAFDSWLPHRGTLPRGRMESASETERRQSFLNLPREQTKFVIYYNASRRRLANTLLEHSLKRGQIELRATLEGRGDSLCFADFPGLRYPQDYAPEIVELVERNGLQMCQLEGRNLATAVELRDRALSSVAFNNYLPTLH